MNYAILLSGGLGLRMNDDVAKASTKLLYKPIISYIIDTIKALDNIKIIPVLGHKKEEIIPLIKNIDYVIQEKPLGIIDAIKTALPLLDDNGYTLIIPGDIPLINVDDLSLLINNFENELLDMALLTAYIKPNLNYDIILKDEANNVLDINSSNNIDISNKGFLEIDTGIYIIKNNLLKKYIYFIDDDKKEYKPKELINLLLESNYKIKAYCVENPALVSGCNNYLELVMLEEYLKKKININLLKNGVYIESPFSSDIITIDSIVESGVKIYSNCKIINSTIRSGAVIKDNSIIINSTIGKSSITSSIIEDSIIGDNIEIGPFYHIKNKKM